MLVYSLISQKGGAGKVHACPTTGRGRGSWGGEHLIDRDPQDS